MKKTLLFWLCFFSFNLFSQIEITVSGPNEVEAEKLWAKTMKLMSENNVVGLTGNATLKKTVEEKDDGTVIFSAMMDSTQEVTVEGSVEVSEDIILVRTTHMALSLTDNCRRTIVNVKEVVHEILGVVDSIKQTTTREFVNQESGVSSGVLTTSTREDYRVLD